jgi:hypothetical protein
VPTRSAFADHLLSGDGKNESNSGQSSRPRILKPQELLKSGVQIILPAQYDRSKDGCAGLA